MAWPLVAAAAGMEADKGLTGWLTRPKVPRAEQTATGRDLMRRSQYGAYDPAARRKIIGAASRASGNAAQTAAADMRGQLVSSGMDDSIAGQRLMATPALQRAGYLAETGERMEAENEQAKGMAREQFAGLQDRLDEQRRYSRRQGLQSLLGGAINAAGAGINTAIEERSLSEMKDFDRQYAQIDLLIQAGRYDEAERLLGQLTGGGALGVSTTRGLNRSALRPQEAVMQQGRY